MHLCTTVLLLGLLPSALLAAPTRRVDPLLNSLFTSPDGRGAAADLSYAQAQKAMQDNPNLVAHLTDKGRERLEATVRKAEEDQLRAVLREQHQAVGGGARRMAGMGGAMGGVGVAQKPQGAGVWRDKASRTRVRLGGGSVFQGSGAKQPTSARISQQPSNPHALPIKNTTPFFSSLRRANEALKHPSTSLSVLHIQTEDDSPSIFSEPIQWVALPNSRRHEGFWEVPVDSLQVNGKRIEGPFAGAVLDPTSNRLAVPTDIAERLFKLVPDARPLPSTSATSSAISYSYSCDSTTLFSLSFAHHTHALLPNEFNITPLASVSGKRCLAAVYGLRLLDEGARKGGEEEEILS